MALEHFVAGKNIPTDSTAALRSQAAATRKYILVDPVTLCFPMILGQLRGSFSVQETSAFRLQATVASISPMIK